MALQPSTDIPPPEDADYSNAYGEVATYTRTLWYSGELPELGTAAWPGADAAVDLTLMAPPPLVGSPPIRVNLFRCSEVRLGKGFYQRQARAAPPPPRPRLRAPNRALRRSPKPPPRICSQT